MDFHYVYPVKASPDDLWAVVSDIPTVGGCIPGAENVQREPDGTYSGTVKVRVGPIGLGLNGKLTVDQLDAEARTISLSGGGADRRVPGDVRIKIRLAVTGAGANSELVVDSEANILGKLGEFGQGIIKRKADGIMRDFGKNLTKKVEG
ncbi:MAG: SRPBCC family protein [Dehalococcoidia bacterium]